jgi:predicted DCC family thiol-disulfide oxidoreductase YuxK
MNGLPQDVERLILFDGHCNLCNFWVKFVLQADSKRRFHFAALQTATARSLLDRYSQLDIQESVVLWERDRISTRSTATLRILWLLGGVWRLTVVGYVVPRFLRDPIYDFVAKRRYLWFGRQDQCATADESVRERFIE